MSELKKAVNEVIDYLTSEFIVEECADSPVEGCLSCEMIEVRASLFKVLNILDDTWIFTPEELDAHLDSKASKPIQ